MLCGASAFGGALAAGKIAGGGARRIAVASGMGLVLAAGSFMLVRVLGHAVSHSAARSASPAKAGARLSFLYAVTVLWMFVVAPWLGVVIASVFLRAL